ncbi:hypothetical protein ACF1G5_19755 [Streptomyces coeruleorubidus]|uniref:hypothetical protein n=1 Tax=Streptomyces coeruleorubidus TaxID=116188 RepID=UPI0036FA1870
MARHDSPARPAALMTQALTGPVAQAQSVAGIPVVGEAARLPSQRGLHGDRRAREKPRPSRTEDGPGLPL